MFPLIEKATRRSIHLRALYEMKVGLWRGVRDMLADILTPLTLRGQVTFINLTGHLKTYVRM